MKPIVNAAGVAIEEGCYLMSLFEVLCSLIRMLLLLLFTAVTSLKSHMFDALWFFVFSHFGTVLCWIDSEVLWWVVAMPKRAPRAKTSYFDPLKLAESLGPLCRSWWWWWRWWWWWWVSGWVSGW